SSNAAAGNVTERAAHILTRRLESFTYFFHLIRMTRIRIIGFSHCPSRVVRIANRGDGPGGRAIAAHSGSDFSAVILRDDDGGRSRYRVAAIGPVAFARFAGVLDIDEHGLAIRRESDARDLAFFGSHEKAAYFFAGGIRAQHLVIALALVLARVGVLAVGLYP